MDDLLKIFDELLENSRKNQHAKKRSDTTWKHCVVLHKTGWRAIESERVDEEFCDDMIITWQKEGKTITMRLPFSEQCLWLEHLIGEENK
jgi:hypothetical protein